MQFQEDRTLHLVVVYGIGAIEYGVYERIVLPSPLPRCALWEKFLEHGFWGKRGERGAALGEMKGGHSLGRARVG